MSLVLTLALRNLFQDRLRFIASLMGIVFSVVLVMVQAGLYFGFSGMITLVLFGQWIAAFYIGTCQ